MPVVKLTSINGDEVCPAVTLDTSSTLSELEVLALQALGAKRCRLVSQSGVEVDTAATFGASGLEDGEIVMVVALFDPLDKYHPFVLDEDLLACLPHLEYGDHITSQCTGAFEQYRGSDGLLYPESLVAALQTMMSHREAEGMVATWSRRDCWKLAPLSLTDFVSLMHGSWPLTPDDIAELHRNFILHDDCGDGTVLSSKFFKTDLWTVAANGPNILPLFQAEGHRTNSAGNVLPPSLQPWDAGGDARMTFEQFLSLSVLKRLWTYRDGEQDLCESFRIFDVQGTGFVSVADLRFIMRYLGFDEDFDEMIQEANVTGDGQINYEVFNELMMGK